MNNKWNKPEMKILGVSNTKENPTPFYWWPNYPECKDPTNTGEGYQMCTKFERPCKYFGILAGGSIAECNAPSKKNPVNQS